MTRLLTIAAILLAAPPARAGGFAVSEQGVVAAGTGNAGTAREGDPAAGWFNPAALADAMGWRAAVGLVAATPALTATDPDGEWSTRSESKLSTPPHLYASYAWDEWAAGIAAGVPHGGGVTWPADWEGRYEIVGSDLLFFRVAPFVAWRTGRLRLAGGLHVDAGRLRIQRKLDFVDTEGDALLQMTGMGVGFDAAVFYDASDAVAVGLSFKSRTKMNLTGQADFTVPDSFSAKAADGHVATTLTLPDRLSLGVAYRRGSWRALVDLDLAVWAVNNEMVIDFENEMTEDVVQQNHWASTVAVRGGAEVALSARVTVRGGAFFDPSPARDETLAPSSPDSNRLGVTAGASYVLSRRFTVDAFFEHMEILSRRSTNEEALSARYSGRAELFGLGLRFQQ